MTLFNDQLQQAKRALDTAETAIKEARERAISLGNSILPIIDEESFRLFLKKPYILIQKRAHEWYCIVPKFIDFAIGWLEFSTDSYNRPVA